MDVGAVVVGVIIVVVGVTGVMGLAVVVCESVKLGVDV